MDWTHLAEVSCEHCTESSGSIKCWEILEEERAQPGNIQSRKMAYRL
jgi:hypothetical protein